MKIIRTKIMHPGTFASLVEAALGQKVTLWYRGWHYELISGARSAAVYRRSSHGLSWIQERVENYEFALFQALLRGACDRDGALRPRSHLLRGANGALRPR